MAYTAYSAHIRAQPTVISEFAFGTITTGLTHGVGPFTTLKMFFYLPLNRFSQVEGSTLRAVLLAEHMD